MERGTRTGEEACLPCAAEARLRSKLTLQRSTDRIMVNSSFSNALTLRCNNADAERAANAARSLDTIQRRRRASAASKAAATTSTSAPATRRATERQVEVCEAGCAGGRRARFRTRVNANGSDGSKGRAPSVRDITNEEDDGYAGCVPVCEWRSWRWMLIGAMLALLYATLTMPRISAVSHLTCTSCRRGLSIVRTNRWRRVDTCQ